MGLTAPIVDGKLVTNTQETKETSTAGKNSLDKDAFLQLLVAQIKYQDPLEPTSNTEYISQYATFSELEQMQNMSSSMTLSRASELVGKEVIMESTSESGKTTTVQGLVEKVVYNGSKAFLSINGSLYSMDDLKQVVDESYKLASEYVEEMNAIMKKLPSVESLTLADMTNVSDLYKLYQSVYSYNPDMVDAATTDKIKKYVEKMTELVNQAQEDAANEKDEADNESEESKEVPEEV